LTNGYPDLSSKRPVWQILYREDGSRTLVGEGKGGRRFRGSQVFAADVAIGGQSSMSIGVCSQKRRNYLQALQTFLVQTLF
jgi:hypothetical protein